MCLMSWLQAADGICAVFRNEGILTYVGGWPLGLCVHSHEHFKYDYYYCSKCCCTELKHN